MIIKRVLPFTLFLVSFSRLFCQSLEGEWEGWYNINGTIKDTAIVKLQFRLNKDGTYDVYSFTRFRSDKSVCKMSYKMLSEHSIYLEENELIRTNKDSQDYLFQKMTLQFDNSFKWMRGKWSARDGKLKYTGYVAFTKKT